MNYKTPGVYVEEISKFPPSVAQVETAIPAFIGYTEKATDENGVLITSFPYVARIKSFADYTERFGGPADVYPASGVGATVAGGVITLNPTANNKKPKMYYAMQMYFANGGGPCYTCAAETYASADFTNEKQMEAGLTLVGKEDEPTILVFPDATGFANAQVANFYNLYKSALSQSANLGDRVTLVDIYTDTGAHTFGAKESEFRGGIGSNHLKYGIANYPYLKTTMFYEYNESLMQVDVEGDQKTLKFESTTPTTPLTPAEQADSVFHSNNDLYHKIKLELNRQSVVLAPSAAVAGIYANVDRTRGVWKAPANVSLTMVKELMVEIDDEDQRDMNVHVSGKSVNAIRNFSNKGTMLWGARTLAGNDNEWRYVPVRRFFNMVEESVKKATMQFVFEPNDANTWVRVRAMIENFLSLQWRAGALAGAVPEDAFFVRVGLGQTMTAVDVLEGRMNVEIGMAVVRPAEFIILKFSHKMQES